MEEVQAEKPIGNEKAVLQRHRIPNVVLIGATGSGKTVVGRHLAQLLGFGFIDLDSVIENRTGKAVARIFAEQGERAFRSQEHEALKFLAKIQNHVIVPGAGAVEDEENWHILKKLGPVIWLATPTHAVVSRLVMKPDELLARPLLSDALKLEDPEERRRYLTLRLDELQKRRLEFYQRADFTLASYYCTPETTAHAIKALLLEADHPQPEPNRI